MSSGSSVSQLYLLTYVDSLVIPPTMTRNQSAPQESRRLSVCIAPQYPSYTHFCSILSSTCVSLPHPSRGQLEAYHHTLDIPQTPLLSLGLTRYSIPKMRVETLVS